MGLLKNIRDYATGFSWAARADFTARRSHDVKAAVKRGYDLLIKHDGATPDIAFAWTVGWWFNRNEKIIENDALVDLLKLIGCYTIDQAAEVIDTIERAQREPEERHSRPCDSNHYVEFLSTLIKEFQLIERMEEGIKRKGEIIKQRAWLNRYANNRR